MITGGFLGYGLFSKINNSKILKIGVKNVRSVQYTITIELRKEILVVFSSIKR